MMFLQRLQPTCCNVVGLYKRLRCDSKAVFSDSESIKCTRNMNYLHEFILFVCLPVSVFFLESCCRFRTMNS